MTRWPALLPLLALALLLAGDALPADASHEGSARQRAREVGSRARQVLDNDRFQTTLPHPPATSAGPVRHPDPRAVPHDREPAPPPPTPVPSTPGGAPHQLLWVLLGMITTAAAVWVLREVVTLRRQAADLTGTGGEEQPGATTTSTEIPAAQTLADRGCFAAAVHSLLDGALNSLARGRRVAIMSCTTSREVVRQLGPDDDLRSALMVLVSAVEYSLFGGREVSRDEYLRCRAAFEQISRLGAGGP